MTNPLSWPPLASPSEAISESCQSAVEPSIQRAAVRETATPFRSGRSRILIVEDDPLNRQMLQCCLEDQGYEVGVALTGDEALELAARNPPDVVLLDVVMPGLDGYEVCRLLRAHPELSQLHILMLTTLTGRESRLRGLEAGADEFLIKPVDLLELRTRLRTITRLNRFRQLSNERSRFEAAVTHSPDGLVLTDGTGAILHKNPAFDRLAGEGRDIFDQFNPDLRSRLLAELPHLQVGATFGPVETTLRRHTPAGQVELTVVRLPNGQSEMLQFILRDITERKRLETQLLRSQRVELLGQVAGGIVHDVNNILTGIVGNSSLLKFCDPIETPSLCANIEDSAMRGAALLRGILSFARGAETTFEPTDVAATTRDALQMAKQVIGSRVATVCNTSPHLSRISADANQLQQILLNLCVNGRDAMPQGGTLTVTIAQTHLSRIDAATIGPDALAGDFLTLSVRDTGTGIPREVLPRLFDPFFTTKANGKGTGLGLATVQRIVRNHGGFIGVETRIDVGTCFTCYFPMPPTPAGTGEPQPSPAF
jgi:two-component system cell cycle sensor histidine kinase/response regulator CckA